MSCEHSSKNVVINSEPQVQEKLPPLGSYDQREARKQSNDLPVIGVLGTLLRLKVSSRDRSTTPENSRNLVKKFLFAKDDGSRSESMHSKSKFPQTGMNQEEGESKTEENRKPEGKSRGRSLPPLKFLTRHGSQRAHSSRRISALPTLFEDKPKPTDERKLPAAFNVDTMSKRLQVEGGLLSVGDSFEIDWIPREDKDSGGPVTHLIYGENYSSGRTRNRGMPDEILTVLKKTPKLECLEIRGHWDFSRGPVNLTNYLEHLPRLEAITKLVLPKNGKSLDKMGSILVGRFGKTLNALECDVTFFETSCGSDLSLLTPNLRTLKIYEITSGAMQNLRSASWKLEELSLGDLHGSSVRGIAWDLLEAIVCQFGENLIKLEYSFPVVDTGGNIVDPADVEIILKKYMLL